MVDMTDSLGSYRGYAQLSLKPSIFIGLVGLMGAYVLCRQLLGLPNVTTSNARSNLTEEDF
jgi:hypothetical protein